jgi:hypothetical protein
LFQDPSSATRVVEQLAGELAERDIARVSDVIGLAHDLERSRR